MCGFLSGFTFSQLIMPTFGFPCGLVAFSDSPLQCQEYTLSNLGAEVSSMRARHTPSPSSLKQLRNIDKHNFLIKITVLLQIEMALICSYI